MTATETSLCDFDVAELRNVKRSAADDLVQLLAGDLSVLKAGEVAP